MNKTLAKIISVILHPLLLPSLGILILLNSGSVLEYLPLQAKKIILLIVCISTLVLPLTFVPFFIFQKIIKNVHMENSRERLIPFFVTSAMFAFGYYLLIRLGAPQTITRYILAATTSAFVLFLLTFKWKISAHLLGWGGLTGTFIAVSFRLNINLEYLIIASILISGLIGYTRLYLKTHKSYEVYSGWLLGCFISILVILFF